ncbi:hypothetical protein UFOVP824_14 [uncultured Caudovirales phage]|uniref:Uncharacterized protein n=1 Tax=uncultured Caudovirales phage TaxID=2100421 RepID=A0A6J5P7C3_9CAUD|nr:hypothetical protein UFOVP824_14 [uncultured Caudovirales phage]
MQEDKSIDEVMGESAPSQNPQIAPTAVAPTSMVAPVVPGPTVDLNDAQAVKDSIAQRANRRRMLGISAALQQNPEQAAEAQRVAALANVSPEVARANLNDLNHRARMREWQDISDAKTHPVLMRQMEDPEFASIAQDDVKNLLESDSFWDAMPPFSGSKIVDYFIPNWAKAQVVGGVGRAIYQADQKALYERLLFDTTLKQDEEADLIKQYQKLSDDSSKLSGISSGWFGSPAYLGGQMASSMPTALEWGKRGFATGTVIGGGVGLFTGGVSMLATVPAAAIAGFGTGFATGMAYDSFMANGGAMYFDSRIKGYDAETALTMSVIAGGAMAAVDVLSLKSATAFSRAMLGQKITGYVADMAVSKTITGAASAIEKPFAQFASRRAAMELISAPTLGAAIRRGSTEMAFSGGKEGVGEVFQDGIAWGVEMTAYQLQSPEIQRMLKQPDTYEEFASQAVDTFREMMQGGWIFSAPGAALMIANTPAKITKATQTRDFIATLSDQAKNSKVRARNPDRFQDWLASRSRGRVGETLFVDAQQLSNVLTQAEIPMDIAEKAIPGITKQLAEARTTDGDVAIPVSQFAAKLAGTQFGDALIPHIRLDPNDISFADAPAAERQRVAMEETVKRRASQIMEDKAQADEKFVKSSHVVEDQVREQLVQTGRMGESDAGVAATLIRDFVVVMAARSGMSPEKYLEEHRDKILQIQGQEQRGAEAAGEFNQAGERRTDAPKFRSWFGDSKIVDAQGNPLVVYHGSQNPSLSGFREGGVAYFTSDKDLADSFARRTEGGEPLLEGEVATTYPVYLSLKNPLVITTNEEYERLMQDVSVNRAELMRQGYDGIVYQPQGGGSSYYAIFDPRQAKSADNRGTWDGTSANMLEQSSVDRLQMEVKRGRRQQAEFVQLTAKEEEAVAKAASVLGENADEIRQTILKHKMAHPVEQGWAPLEFKELKPKDKEDKGKTGIGLTKYDFVYNDIPYGFSDSADGSALEVGSPEYKSRVNAMSRRMVDEVRKVFRRAQAGDRNAAKIIEQSTWYASMRAALRREFGGLGDLMADLLGATSPNSPVRQNWEFTIDILRRAMRGDFDDLMTKWEAWSDAVDQKETALRAYINEQTAEMQANGGKLNKAAIARTDKYKALFAELKEARELPDELLPRQANGQKYGFNGGNVVRAMLGLWRTVREEDTLMGTTAQAPKALTFSGNLIGFRERATIDVWAARMLQRLAGLMRVPSMSETGVSGDMLVDGRTTLQFGFGQDVFAEASRRIRSDAQMQQNAKLAALKDDDLQALVWFIEKELWTINDWTSVAGEGGSFELEASLTGSDNQARVRELRKIINAGIPSKLQDAASKMDDALESKRKWLSSSKKAKIRKKIADLQAQIAATDPKPTKKRISELKNELKELEEKSGIAAIDADISIAAKAEEKIYALEEGRTRARAELIGMERRVDRYTAGLSEQKSMDSQGVDYVPTDADQARLAEDVRTGAYQNDPGERIVAVKTGSTEGRYGGVERSLDLEVVARSNWDPTGLWRVMVEKARDAKQESTFLSRVLRKDEAIDPTKHRPGLEIYFRSPVSRDKLDSLIAKLNAAGVDFFTVIVDSRRSGEARSGAMSDAVGIRMQYVPEYMHRYGIEELAGLSDSELATKMEEREKEWLALAEQAMQVMPEISFAGVFWHETRVAFADAYQEELNAIAGTTTEGDGGVSGQPVWAGKSAREGVAAADRFRTAKAAESQPGGGGQVLGGIQEGGGVFEQSAILTFNSALWTNIEGMDVPEAGLTGQGWKERVQGLVNKGVIKESELEWSGFPEYLEAQSGKLTKDQIISAFEDKGGVVRVEVDRNTKLYGERLLREARGIVADRVIDDLTGAQVQLTALQIRALNYYATLGDEPTRDNPQEYAVWDQYRDVLDKLMSDNDGSLQYDSLQQYLLEETESLRGHGQNTKYGSHIVDGAKDEYTEILIRLPVQGVIGTVAGRNVQSNVFDELNLAFNGYASIFRTYDEDRSAVVAFLEKSLKSDADYSNSKKITDDLSKLTTDELRESGIPVLVEVADELSQRMIGLPKFRDNHWDEPNVLCFARYTIRIDSNGKRVLLVEEVQSDYAHEARERGTASSSAEARDASVLATRKASAADAISQASYDQGIAKAGTDERYRQRAAYLEFLNEQDESVQYDLVGHNFDKTARANYAPTYLALYDIVNHPGISEENARQLLSKLGMPEVLFEQLKATYAAEQQRVEADSRNLLVNQSFQQGRGKDPIPNAPFIESTDAWVTLVLKQIVMEAQQQGVDSIVLADAGVHIDRWGSQEFMWESAGEGKWKVSAIEQTGGNAMGMDLEAEAISRGLAQRTTRVVSSQQELRALLTSWSDTDISKDGLAAKIWKRMQSEPTGQSKPRSEAMWAFYGNADGINPKTGKPSILRLNMEKLGKKLGGVTISKNEIKLGDPAVRMSQVGGPLVHAWDTFRYEVQDAAAHAYNGDWIANWEDMNPADTAKSNAAVVELLQSERGQLLIERLHDRLVSDRHIGKLYKVIPSTAQLTEDLIKAFEKKNVGLNSPMTELRHFLIGMAGKYGMQEPLQPGLSMTLTDPAKAKVNEGLPLFQATTGPGPRRVVRGTFDPVQMMLTLTNQSNMSTFLHESGHYFLTALAKMAGSATANEQMRNDMDKILSWFGIPGATAQDRLDTWNKMSLEEQRQYHEQFAYNFEIYLAEGRAPSLEMQSAFEQFAMWLKRVYKSITTELNERYRRQFGRDLPIMSGEVRDVMDRLLATEKQIKEAEAVRQMMPLMQTQEESGMNDTEWAEYQAHAAEATRQAISEYRAESIGQAKWMSRASAKVLSSMRAEEQERRGEVRKEMQAKVAAQPVYRAMRYLRSGEYEKPDGTVVKDESGYKMSRAGVDEVVNSQSYSSQMSDHGIDPLSIPRWASANEGQHPDVVAERFGFSSGADLLLQMSKARSMKEEVDAQTDAEMKSRYGDEDSQKAREEAVARAIHNEARARFLAVEYRWLAKATQPVRIMLEAARQVARGIIADKKIRDLRPGDYQAAESRAARDADTAHQARISPDQAASRAYTKAYNEQQSAIAAGMPVSDAVAIASRAAAEARQSAVARQESYRAKYEDASPEEVVLRAKRAQLLQNQLSAEALKTQAEIKKAVKYLKEVLSDRNRRKIGADAADQIEQLMEAIDLRPMSNKASDLRVALADYLTQLEEEGVAPDISERVRKGMLRKPYRELTVGEFRELIDAIKQIEYIAKNKYKILRMQEQLDFETVRDGMVVSLNSNARGREIVEREPVTKWQRRVVALKGYFAAHLKAGAIARIMDGGRDDGMVWNYFIRPGNEAGDRETTMRSNATQALSNIMAPVFALGRIEGDFITFPTLNGRSLTRGQRMAIALNMGNAGNMQRLLDGEGWSIEQITPVLESLTTVEWQAVQQIWDHLETYRPMIAAKERRVYGKEPDWVDPVPLTVRTANGNTLTLRGGYYPIKYDSRANIRVGQLSALEQADRDRRDAMMTSTTRRSFTKNRVERVDGRPISLTLNAMFSGVNEVIHDLCWHEWLIQANKMTNDSKFQRAVSSGYGKDFFDTMREFIKRVAGGDKEASDAVDRACAYLARNGSAAAMGFQLVSAAQQTSGLANSIARVGVGPVASGIWEMIKNPARAMREVSAKSEFMKNRSLTQFKELNEIRNRVQGQSKVDMSWRSGVYFLMMRMQKLVDVPTWIGAYEKALAEIPDESRAIAIADQTVIDTQGSGMLKDQSAVESGGGVKRMGTMFYSYMNTVFNQAVVSAYTDESKGKMAANMLLLLVAPVVINRMIKDFLTPTGDDDSEDYWRNLPARLAMDEASYLLGTMVVMREFGSALDSYGYSGPAGYRSITDIATFGKESYKAVVNQEFDRGFRKAAVNVLGTQVGIPSVQINRTLDGIEAIMEGKTENPLAPLTGYRDRIR